MSRPQGPLPFSFEGIEPPEDTQAYGHVPDGQNVFQFEDEVNNEDDSLRFNWAEEMPWEDVGLTGKDGSLSDEEAELDRLFGPLRG